MAFGTVTCGPILYFLISYTVVYAQYYDCFYNLTEPTDRVFLSAQDNSSLCTWLVTGPEDSVIEFDLEIVDLPVNSSQLVFGVGEEPSNSSTEYATYRPSETITNGRPKKLVVPHSTAWIELRGVGDQTTNFTVLFSYKIIPRVVCDSPVHQTALQGVMTSINYPEEYPINGECTWKFKIPEGHMIELTFHDFDLQEDNDFLLVGDGTEVLEGVFTPYTGRLETSSYVISFTYSHVWLLFISNHLQDVKRHSGFNVSYVIKPKGSENDIPRIQTIAIPKPSGTPFVEKIKLTISGITHDKMRGKLELLKASIAGFVTAYCKHVKSICGTQTKQIRSEDVNISNVREDGHSVDVELTLKSVLPVNMAAISSLHLDKLADEKALAQDTGPIQPMQSGSGGPVDGFPLPRWLIGVIAVVAFLVVVFFVLIVYSLLKDRKKPEKVEEDGSSDGASERELAKTNSTKRKTKSETETTVETVTEVTAHADVPNGTTQSKTTDIEENKPTKTEGKSEGGCQTRAEPEGKSDVNVIEPLQSSSSSSKTPLEPGPESEQVEEEAPPSTETIEESTSSDCPDNTDHHIVHTNTDSNDNRAPSETTEECPAPELDLSTDL